MQVMQTADDNRWYNDPHLMDFLHKMGLIDDSNPKEHDSFLDEENQVPVFFSTTIDYRIERVLSCAVEYFENQKCFPHHSQLIMMTMLL